MNPIGKMLFFLPLPMSVLLFRAIVNSWAIYLGFSGLTPLPVLGVMGSPMPQKWEKRLLLVATAILQKYNMYAYIIYVMYTKILYIYIYKSI